MMKPPQFNNFAGAPPPQQAPQFSAPGPAGGPQTIQAEPQLMQILQQIGKGVQGIDPNSPEYRNSMAAQLEQQASSQMPSNAMGAAGYALGNMAGAYNDQQARKQQDMIPWMPVVTKA